MSTQPDIAGGPARVERRGAPSLFGNRAAAPDGARAQTLLDLLHEGFHMLFLLKSGAAPPDGTQFSEQVVAYLRDFEREAHKLRAQVEDIEAAKYAYCAALDEFVLASSHALHEAWQRRPLQLILFGDQLAGEHFFDRLEALRVAGAPRLPALQVFHMCLLLGFHGKYALDSADKLAYLTARLGDEIAHLKGRRAQFAPRAERPDQVAHKLRGNVPLWALSALFALLGAGVYTGLRTSLDHDTRNAIAGYADLVKLAPRPASFVLTLP
ncbi:type IVB secretion system protein IcmH/DotU [Pseudoduganella armeniaca]|uniref:Type VI secretion system protein ImpK n=1 Tax=Pseudoduganella armeniaca TaxID=2072590 RepID=A0A2R4CDY9_9BURK|nr:type IVB secretion system protein IcmH/DotU [Pseudoduganella armeniaca]AVR97835.1 type VI secretion system protein ImpK [Pseudoduganella armeniaca]